MFVIKAHSRFVQTVAFSPDGRLLATGTRLRDGLRLWDLASGTTSAKWTIKRPTHRVTFSPDGRFLAVVGVALPNNPVGLAVYSTDGNLVVELSVEDYYVRFAEFESDSRHIVIADYRSFYRFEIEPEEVDSPLTRFTSATDNFSKAVLSPDGRYLAAVKYPDRLHTMDARTGTVIAECPLKHNYLECNGLAFSPDAELIAAACGPTLLIGQTLTGVLVASRRVGRRHFNDLKFTPDGRRLVTVSNDETARLWDTESWNEVGGFEWKIGRLRTVAVSPDGLRMAAGADSGKVVVWDYDG
jgi:WD40 repeat protein